MFIKQFLKSILFGKSSCCNNSSIGSRSYTNKNNINIRCNRLKSNTGLFKIGDIGLKNNARCLSTTKINYNNNNNNIVEPETYTLPVTDFKREKIYDLNGLFINTKPFHIINGDITKPIFKQNETSLVKYENKFSLIIYEPKNIYNNCLIIFDKDNRYPSHYLSTLMSLSSEQSKGILKKLITFFKNWWNNVNLKEIIIKYIKKRIIKYILREIYLSELFQSIIKIIYGYLTLNFSFNIEIIIIFPFIYLFRISFNKLKKFLYNLRNYFKLINLNLNSKYPFRKYGVGVLVVLTSIPGFSYSERNHEITGHLNSLSKQVNKGIKKDNPNSEYFKIEYVSPEQQDWTDNDRDIMSIPNGSQGKKGSIDSITKQTCLMKPINREFPSGHIKTSLAKNPSRVMLDYYTLMQEQLTSYNNRIRLLEEYKKDDLLDKQIKALNERIDNIKKNKIEMLKNYANNSLKYRLKDGDLYTLK